MLPRRPFFWNIDAAWIFYLLAAVAVAIFFFGLFIHLSLWVKGVRRQKISLSSKAVSDLVLDGLLGRRIFRGDIAAGAMHLLILWGFLGLFIGTSLLAVDEYIFSFLTGAIYIVYSVCLEIAGLMLLTGLLLALFRRYLQRVSRLERRPEDLLVVLWLLIVGLSGFALEGSRLASQVPEWGMWSFAGYWVSLLWSDIHGASSAYLYLWWGHAILSLGLIAYIPFCKLFHVLAAPASIYLRDQPLQIIPVADRGEDQEIYSYRDMVFFDACTRCGRCVEVCPSTGAGEPFTPRDFIQWARESLTARHHPLNRFPRFKDRTNRKPLQEGGFDLDRVWHCTTCRACLEVCPVYISPPDAIQQSRSGIVEEGTRVPSLLTQSLKNVYKYNNPWEATKKKRTKWSGDMEIPEFTGEGEGFCYFVGCTTSMETRAQAIARSFVSILRHTGTPFGTLGKKEPCCGDIARRAGEFGLFEMKTEDCTDLFSGSGVREVVTSSPHCYHTFRNEYPALRALKQPGEGEGFRARHYSEILGELIQKGALSFSRPLKARVTFHDPCYLGRHNRIFDVPRDVIRAIPGVELVEMAHHRENSLCCGGGGDRMWQEEMDGDPKMSEIRIQEAAAVGAEVVITACPLCLIMLEDARKTSGLEDTLRVMDLNELVVEALGPEGPAGNGKEEKEG